MIEWERLSSWGENSQNENRLDFSVLQQKVRVEIQKKLALNYAIKFIRY